MLLKLEKRVRRTYGDYLCRFGSDDFVVLLDDMAAASDAELVARQIMNALHQPIIVSNRCLTLSASIGVAGLKGHDLEQDALREADPALELAKTSGKAQVALYSDALKHDAHHRLELESALTEALSRDQFEIHYQPIVEVAGTRSRVVGVEALLRWRSGDRLVPPDEFISVNFGTGFSSLGYLHRYPLHIIKVDKSFITKAAGDERLKAISRAIISLRRDLRMDIIAEGIESPEQMEFLHTEGCQFVQGYWFGRSQPAGLIKPLLDSMLDPDSERHSAASALLH